MKIQIKTRHNGKEEERGVYDTETFTFTRKRCPLYPGNLWFTMECDVYAQLVRLGCLYVIYQTRPEEAARGVTCTPTMQDWGRAAKADKGGDGNSRWQLFLFWNDYVEGRQFPSEVRQFCKSKKEVNKRKEKILVETLI